MRSGNGDYVVNTNGKTCRYIYKYTLSEDRRQLEDLKQVLKWIEKNKVNVFSLICTKLQLQFR